MEINELMFELSHLGRLKTLDLLTKEPMRLSQISQMLSITTAEGFRHLERLSKAMLIEKRPDNLYHITPFGLIILEKVERTRFFLENVDYFMTHDLTVLPQECRWLEPLSNSEVSEGTLKNMGLIQTLSAEAESYLNIISDQPLATVVDLNVEKATKGVKVRIIYPNDVQIPEEYRNNVAIEIRTLDRTPVALKANEKVAGLALPDLATESVDFSMVLMGDAKCFHTWTNMLFEHFWDRAKPLKL